MAMLNNRRVELQAANIRSKHTLEAPWFIDTLDAAFLQWRGSYHHEMTIMETSKLYLWGKLFNEA